MNAFFIHCFFPSYPTNLLFVYLPRVLHHVSKLLALTMQTDEQNTFGG